MLRLIKQSSPKTCNIACIQMLTLFFQKDFSEEYIKEKLPQHPFGNWLPEIALFLESEGIKTEIYTNSDCLPKAGNDNPNLPETLEEYKKVGTLKIEKITKAILNDRPMILNIDRSKLLKNGKAKAPHYIVLIKDKEDILVFDPLKDKPEKMSFQDLYEASLDINAIHHNGLLMLCR